MHTWTNDGCVVMSSSKMGILDLPQVLWEDIYDRLFVEDRMRMVVSFTGTGSRWDPWSSVDRRLAQIRQACCTIDDKPAFVGKKDVIRYIFDHRDDHPSAREMWKLVSDRLDARIITLENSIKTGVYDDESLYPTDYDLAEFDVWYPLIRHHVAAATAQGFEALMNTPYFNYVIENKSAKYSVPQRKATLLENAGAMIIDYFIRHSHCLNGWKLERFLERKTVLNYLNCNDMPLEGWALLLREATRHGKFELVDEIMRHGYRLTGPRIVMPKAAVGGIARKKGRRRTFLLTHRDLIVVVAVCMAAGVFIAKYFEPLARWRKV